jgi:hypothetical protein
VNHNQFGLLLVVTLIGSCMGGIFGDHWLAPSLATAEKANSAHAEEFLLLDPSGKARAGLGLDPNGEVGLVLRSRDGNRRLYLTPDEPTVIKLTDRDGRIIWSMP